MSCRHVFPAGLVLFCLFGISSLALAQNRAQIVKEFDLLWEQIKAKEPALLAVSDEDRAANARFLAQPDTGIIRLLPRDRYDGKLNIRGGGAYYSFVRLTHEYGYGSDISLDRGLFGVGFAGADYGFFVSLGSLPLSEATLDHPALRYMADYKPPSRRAEINRQELWKGVESGGYLYRSSLPAIVGNTYAVRSIGYDRSDILVAFHVLRRDEDGSFVLLWRRLATFPTPILIRDN